MGLILAPIFIFVVGLVILNSYHIKRLHKNELLNYNIFIYGFLISIIIYGMILFSYFLEGKYYALSPYFRIPICMFFIPSAIGLLGMNTKNHKLKIIFQSLIASTLTSVTVVLVFSSYFFYIIELLGLEKYY